jgi:hypothetical protein
MSWQLPRLSAAMAVLVAVIVVGVLADAVVVVNQLRSSNQTQASHSQSSKHSSKNGQHPCNHGFYVSQAAHAHKGGDYVKQIAQSDLGKNGDCSAPLPAQAPASKKSKKSASESDDSDD